ncbi:hypothetical protein A0H81_03289 [Grifola frondosa]|uniref:Uncharacterized protein n=1 Tax=Grifola frondosa TaxID=5627 RepID=A0A1C7MJG5_GRIFR|nr:hypothetical protein A0H81_03289 [Grifola frondosa]
MSAWPGRDRIGDRIRAATPEAIAIISLPDKANLVVQPQLLRFVRAHARLVPPLPPQYIPIRIPFLIISLPSSSHLATSTSGFRASSMVIFHMNRTRTRR